MKCSITLTHRDNTKTTINDAYINVKIDKLYPTIAIEKSDGHYYYIDMSNIKRIIIDPHHIKQTFLKSVLDDIAFTKFKTE